ncbi:MAG TPA: helix-turn-helix domain-containing protein [Bryobacteraceae bacterium]|nr:helix-turn-helix domain-containing protein [Bryobacteraceae bacterium]
MKETFERLVDHLLESGFFLEEAVEILEKNLIARAVERTDGNRCAASKLLGIHRNTLQRKIIEYQLDGGRPRKKPARRATAAQRRARAG